MRVLFDQGTSLPLKRWLAAHHVETAHQRGWSKLLNSELLAAAEAAGFDLLITTDQNLRHQQDLSRFGIAVLVLMIANWPTIEPHAPMIAAAVDKIRPRLYVEWSPPE
jgi:predicted nuclease of predicted toxin-antitoxin system